MMGQTRTLRYAKQRCALSILGALNHGEAEAIAAGAADEETVDYPTSMCTESSERTAL
jgi:hypothetical protein